MHIHIQRSSYDTSTIILTPHSYYSHTVTTRQKAAQPILVPQASKEPSNSPHMAPPLEETESPERANPPQPLSVPVAAVAPQRRLEELAPELVQQILNDAPIFGVLLLVSCRKPGTFLHQCVLSHPQYKQIFKSQATLTLNQNLAVLLYDIASSLDLFPSKLDSSFLDFPITTDGITCCAKCLKRLSQDLSTAFVTKIQELLASISNDLAITIQEHAEESLTSGLSVLESLNNRWEAIQTAVNNIKAGQLVRMADLLRKYPTMLKNLTGSSQKKRPETEDTVSSLKSLAEVVRRDKCFESSVSFDTYFRYHLLPIVPFDAYLRLFVQTLNQQPLCPSKWLQYSADIAALSWTEATQSPYPENIFNDVKIVVAGLAYVYTIPQPGSGVSSPQVLRTKFTPYSDVLFQRRYVSEGDTRPRLLTYFTTTPAGYVHWQPKSQDFAAGNFPDWAIPYKNQRVLSSEVSWVESARPEDCWDPRHEHPVFTRPPGENIGKLLVHKVENRALPDWKKLLPYHEKELEWLEAFLRVVTFMEGMPKVMEGMRKEREDGL